MPRREAPKKKDLKNYVKAPEFKNSEKGNFKYRLEEFGGVVVGAIVMPPRTSKPAAKCSRGSRYLFMVRTGQVKMFINKKTFIADARSGWIQAGAGDVYKIENFSSRAAEVAYLVTDSNK